ncbi:hypothetical protein K1T71_003219 [Dendrolimus kikuchii]|uniref:Uncharacterized protein n=1 Tax=Dendrolimus kikuchii TaxID=765133 RepID=A0ACC1DBK8_9NEOP|nr:hypothetical protein K1T71_003219 [Dendrolimus kikuchii]
MLESEEVDEDYFTPVANTSLASIFGNKSYSDNNVENNSLKYTPPKQNINRKVEETKASQCIFACALLAYEWSQNVYTPKGKLAFAIINILKNNSYNIVLYDSNKTTISCTIVTRKLEITINKQNYLSYYDSNQRYWSIFATEEETNKITDILKSCGVTIQQVSQTEMLIVPEPDKTVEIPNILNLKETQIKDVESDTDSSLNRKTKASLLNRMATMGHSVLPPRSNVTAKSSDSSDTNDTYEHPKARHKPIKNTVKRNSLEKNTFHEHNINGNQQKIAILTKPEQSHDNFPSVFTYVNGQLVPVTSTNIITNTNNRVGNDLDFFISEQRISSSELRINTNRITDKVDHILDKVNNLQQVDKSAAGSNFQNEILQKLLKEYEDKIKRYEELLTSQMACTSTDTPDTSKEFTSENKIIILQTKLEDLETKYQSKNIEIATLQDEIISLKDTNSKENEQKLDQENEIKHLQEMIMSKDEKIAALLQQNQNNLLPNSKEVNDKIKKIMNETYRAVFANFENNEMYSGENVRNVIALIIKKITIDSLN